MCVCVCVCVCVYMYLHTNVYGGKEHIEGGSSQYLKTLLADGTVLMWLVEGSQLLTNILRNTRTTVQVCTTDHCTGVHNRPMYRCVQQTNVQVCTTDQCTGVHNRPLYRCVQQTNVQYAYTCTLTDITSYNISEPIRLCIFSSISCLIRIKCDSFKPRHFLKYTDGGK